jgi:glycerol kinase
MVKKDRNFILAIDQSTSATKVMIFDHQARLIDRLSYPHQQFYPENDFVEHDPEEIFENTRKGLTEIPGKKQLNALC